MIKRYRFPLKLKRPLACLGIVVLGALGFALAMQTTAKADLVPTVPTESPTMPTEPPTVPSTVTVTLPLPTAPEPDRTTTSSSPDSSPSWDNGAPKGSKDEAVSTLPQGAIVLPSGEVSIPASSVTGKAHLIIARVSFKPNVVQTRRQVIGARVLVKDSRGYLVRSALVSVGSVPAGRVDPVSRRLTGTDGWVSFQLRTTELLPLNKAGRLVLVVRSRTDASAGGRISAPRYVSIRVRAKR